MPWQLRDCLIATLVLCVLFYCAVFIWNQAAYAQEDNLGPGDVRQGYESTSYTSQSKSLEDRTGKAMDLYKVYKQRQLGLPTAESVTNEEMTPEGIRLGRRLFFDRRLSINNTMSCAICHVPEMGFTNHEMQTAVGVEGRTGRRNTPTILNAIYKTRLFHDGREISLENQIWSPLLSSREMANPSVGYVIEKIGKIKDYNGLFEQAFNGKPVSMQTISLALAQYQRTLISANSRFDRWYYGKEETALSTEEKAGFTIFTGQGQCSACHLINQDYALFTDNQWHNTGLGYDYSMRKTPPKTRVQLAPGIFAELDKEVIENVSEKIKLNDVGLYEVTQNPYDRWKYVTPTLRNVSLTKPYMHNGSLLTLEAVIEFYDKGGIKNELLSPLIRPLALSAKEKQNLLAFLRTLNGSNVNELVADAFAAPIGELGADDPFWANQQEMP